MAKDYKEYKNVPAWEQAVYNEKGHVSNLAEGKLIWSGKNGAWPVAIGEKVHVNMNGLGEAKVVGYFSEGGFLGLLVKFDSPPAWYVKQNGANKIGHVFGAEIKPLEAK